jgi:hypothetical protein
MKERVEERFFFGGEITNAYLDGGDMRRLVTLDNCDFLNGDFRRREPGTTEVVRLEFA